MHAKIVQPILGVQMPCKENIKIFNIFFLLLFLSLFFFFCLQFFQQAKVFLFLFFSQSPAQPSKPISYRAVAHPEGVRGGTSSPLDRSNGWHISPFHRGQVPAGDLLSQLRPRRPGACPRGRRRGYLGRRTPQKTLALLPRPQFPPRRRRESRGPPVPAEKQLR